MPSDDIRLNKMEKKLERLAKPEPSEQAGLAYEQRPEQRREAEPGGSERSKEKAGLTSEQPAAVTDSAASSLTSQRLKQRQQEIEQVLEQDLADIYQSLTAEKRQQFKLAGESAAREINSLLEQAKVKAKSIIEIIKKWLCLIPGLNKFFLEQEAKIKADQIVRLK